MKENFGTDPR